MIQQAASTGGSHFQRYLVHFKPSSKQLFYIQESLDGEKKQLNSIEEVKTVIKLD